MQVTTSDKVWEIFSVNSVEGGKQPVSDPDAWVPSKKNPFWEFRLENPLEVDVEGNETEQFLFVGRNAFTNVRRETELTDELQDFIVRAWQISGSDVFDALENEMVNR